LTSSWAANAAVRATRVMSGTRGSNGGYMPAHALGPRAAVALRKLSGDKRRWLPRPSPPALRSSHPAITENLRCRSEQRRRSSRAKEHLAVSASLSQLWIDAVEKVGRESRWALAVGLT
jgi:hypothetical protein